MYVRIKKIKGKEYAYLIQSRWRKRNNNGKRGPRQKVIGYLGKVYRFDVKEKVDFFELFSIKDIDEYVRKNGKEKIINDLVEWEIHKHKINKKDFLVDLKDNKIMKDNKNVVIKINEGYLCGETIRKLLNFRNREEEQQGLELAKRFVQVGIKVPNEVFVGYFEKINKF